MKIQAVLLSKKISSNSKEAFDLFSTQRFGEKDGDKIYYMLEEAYYLIEKNKIQVYSSTYKELSKETVLNKFTKIDKNFQINYIAYKDLKKKSYLVKTGLKFGGTFRVYDKGSIIGKSHSKWVCFAIDSKEKNTWQDFAAKNRVAHSTKKSLLIAIVDPENDVTYYESSWRKII